MSLLEEVKALPTQDKDLRKFAFTVGLVLCLIGAVLFWRGKSFGLRLSTGAGVLISVGILWPQTLRLLYRGWMLLALVLGWVMTRVILSIVFYGAVTPVALVMRMKGVDLLGLRDVKNKNSYWVEKSLKSKESYEKQF